MGFSSYVDQMLIEASKVESCPEREKHVIILLDEMHIREDTGALIGYTYLGDINDHLMQFEQSLSHSSTPATPKLAKTMMVFMVRGLFNKLQFPYAQFPCADLLYELFWEAVRRLENCGLKVCIYCKMLVYLYGCIFVSGVRGHTGWEFSEQPPCEAPPAIVRSCVQDRKPLYT